MKPDKPIEQTISRVMPKRWSYGRRRRTARRMRAKGYSEAIIKEQCWGNW